MRATQVFGAVVAAAVVFGGAAQLASASVPAKTRVEAMSPWASASKLKAGLKVSGTVKGTCWESSMAVNSYSAYRCSGGSEIYDPCFAPKAGTFSQLACMYVPWGEVTLLKLTAALPKPDVSSGPPQVWAYQLGNGTGCVVGTGTNGEVDGVPINYYCTPGTGAASAPNEKTEPWTVRYATSTQAKTLETETVLTAWY
jgi:hypothetical protein